MSRDYNVVVERYSKGYYVASVPGLGLAETVPLSLPEGEHRLRVVVNREASSHREFVAGNVTGIRNK